LISEALRVVLGQAAPNYTLGQFDPSTLKGSIIVAEKDLHLIWAAISIYGQHFGYSVALHINSVHKFLLKKFF
uniref:Ribonuclease P n=1 Tax=Dracunculus medinensis TaxID=318479 RepID=A0A0N4U6T9_DRAME